MKPWTEYCHCLGKRKNNGSLPERRRNKGCFIEVTGIFEYTLVCSSGKGDQKDASRQGGNYEII